MQITSMTNRELYKTLTGHEYPIGKANKSVDQEELLGEALDVSKAIVDPEKIKAFELNTGELGKLKKVDRFEPSGTIALDLTNAPKNSSSGNVDFYDFEKASDIDFNDRFTQMIINAKQMVDVYHGNLVTTKESIAEYYGNMAKRLDEAFAEGKFTKEEYDYLNEGILERMEHTTVCAEENDAFLRVGSDRSMSLRAYERRAAMTPEGRREDLAAAISDYVDRYTKIDRDALMKLFNSYRYSK